VASLLSRWQASAVSFRFVRAGVFAAALGSIVLACSSSDDSSSGDDGELPPVNSECRNITPIHSDAKCDGCTRDLCCPEVQGCEGFAPCRGLIHCLAKCARGDTTCSGACKSEFTGGDTELAAVNGCAEKACPVACGTARIGG
jgi:hypothetical protein